MTKEDLIAKGWGTWYNDDYWVHPKTVADPTRQDYTYYGMSFEQAVEWERENKKPIPAGYDLSSMVQVLKVLDAASKSLQPKPNEQSASEPDEHQPKS